MRHYFVLAEKCDGPNFSTSTSPQPSTNKSTTMKPTIILPLAAACLAPFMINSCSIDPEYREWKKNNQSTASSANPYGVPQAAGENGTYSPSDTTPYQPLPGVNQPIEPSAPDATASTAGSTAHTVVSGDSLWGIARKYGTTIEAIQSANGLTTTSIRTGQELTIPGR